MEMSHTLESVEDVQKAIDKLKSLREAMLKGSKNEEESTERLDQNSNTEITKLPPTSSDLFDSSDIIDMKNIKDVNETDWLRPCDEMHTIEQLESDKSYMDTELYNVQFQLLNIVKGSIFEEKAGKTFQRPTAYKSPLKVTYPSPPKPIEKITNVSEKPMTPLRNFKDENKDVLSSAVSSPRDPIFASSPLTGRFTRDELNEMIDIDNVSNSDFYIATPGKNIDTRTYTRPKKQRTPLDGNLRISSGNNTINLSNKSRTLLFEGSYNKNSNLNETFIQEDADNDEPIETVETTEIVGISRIVTRNLSYVLERENDKSQSNTSKKPDLNSTFVQPADYSPSDSNSSIHNISMEELHTMARLQEQSLKMSSPPRTITRKHTQVIEFPVLDATILRPPVRTSSTDTYSVGQSNPESPGSSGLSSPLDSQSYDDISGETFRRSMPNLAMTKRLSNSGINGLSLAPPMNNLKHKNIYISDSKLSQPALNSRLSALKPQSNSGTLRKPTTVSDHSSKEIKMSHRALVSNGQGGSQGLRNGSGDAPVFRAPLPPRSHSGLAPPRFSSIPSARGIPVKSMLPTPGFSQANQGTARLQSRIPAPGSSRLRAPSRPSTTGTIRQSNGNIKAPDWRDGCY